MMELSPLVKRISASLIVAESFSGLSKLSGKPEANIEQQTIGTHNGPFHCDEALACGLIKLLPDYKDFLVLRTRNPTLLEKCNIVVDVGDVYDPSKSRFDHHQRAFTTKFEDHRASKLSSAGLIYKHFGKEIISVIAKENAVKLDNPTREKLYAKIYNDFIEHIDGIDNGVESRAGELNYKVTTTLSSRVGFLNPAWNEPALEDATAEQTEEFTSNQFIKAVGMATHEFVDCVESALKIWLPARDVVFNAVSDRFSVHESGEIVKLPCYAPWQSHIFNAEKELAVGEGKLKYVLNPRQDGTWSFQCVATEPGSFSSRKRFPEKFSGIRGDVLSNAINIPDCVFVHAAGFTGGNKTYEGVRQMAIFALESN